MTFSEKSADTKVQILAQRITVLKARLEIPHLLSQRAKLLAPHRR